MGQTSPLLETFSAAGRAEGEFFSDFNGPFGRRAKAGNLAKAGYFAERKSTTAIIVMSVSVTTQAVAAPGPNCNAKPQSPPTAASAVINSQWQPRSCRDPSASRDKPAATIPATWTALIAQSTGLTATANSITGNALERERVGAETLANRPDPSPAQSSIAADERVELLFQIGDHEVAVDDVALRVDQEHRRQREHSQFLRQPETPPQVAALGIRLAVRNFASCALSVSSAMPTTANFFGPYLA